MNTHAVIAVVLMSAGGTLVICAVCLSAVCARLGRNRGAAETQPSRGRDREKRAARWILTSLALSALFTSAGVMIDWLGP